MDIKLSQGLQFNNQQSTKVVEYHEVNRFIAQAFGLPEFECHVGANNGQSYPMNITRRDLTVEEISKITVSLKNKNCDIDEVHLILNDLVNNGLIQEGNYLVNVSW